jgi:hypothetical protein
MEIFYRLLGIAARVNVSTSRMSINFLQLNFAMIFLLGLFGFTFMMLSAGETGPPEVVQLADVLEQRDSGRRYVRIKGKLLDTAITVEEKFGRQKDPVVTGTWVPLVDASGKRGIMVELHKTSLSAVADKTVELTGQLQMVDPKLATRLQEQDGKVGGVQVDLNRQLYEGLDAFDPNVLRVLSLVTGIPALLLFITAVNKYVVFRKRSLPSTAPLGDLPAEIDLRVTGRFILGKQDNQRFLDLPAVSGTSEAGELLFVSNVDASVSFLGISANNRKGYWTITALADSLETPESGTFYLGTAARPALRLRYRTGSKRRAEVAVVSFGSELDRYAFLQRLPQMTSVTSGTKARS